MANRDGQYSRDSPPLRALETWDPQLGHFSALKPMSWIVTGKAFLTVEGFAVIKKPWPSMMRTIHNDPDRYLLYWNTIKGFYTAGDVCHKDEDGYLWFMGRADDVVKVAGNRIGTAEVESALVSHEAVVEAAVIGKPHKTAGEMIKAFVILKQGIRKRRKRSRIFKITSYRNSAKLLYQKKLKLSRHYRKLVRARS